MNKLVVFGAGMSATYLIHYFEQNRDLLDLELHVVDQNKQLLEDKCEDSRTTQHQTDINNTAEVEALIEDAKLVVSLLPAYLHIRIARICLECGVNLATASYLSDEMKALHNQVVAKGLVFLNECGLDPGIDHLSAMQMLDSIRNSVTVLIGCEKVISDRELFGVLPFIILSSILL